MAKAASTKETVELDDGTPVVLKPLVISRLRDFMDEWSKVDDLDSKDGENKLTKGLFNVYIRCSAVALEKELGSKEAVTETVGEFREGGDRDADFSKEYLQYLEDVLDLDTIFAVLRVCGGISLGEGDDPKE